MYFQVFIYDILNGEYNDEEKIIVTKSGIRTSQVAVVGYVVKIEDRKKYISAFLNDGTGSIELRFFEPVDLNEGDCLLVLGRVRKFKDAVYIAPKYYTKITEKVYLLFRVNIIKKYLKKNIQFELKIKEKEKEEEHMEKAEETVIETNIPVTETMEYEVIEEKKAEEGIEEIAELRRNIIRLIDDLDRGEGVDVQTLFEFSGAKNKEIFDRVIQELLMTGEIYEPRPGRLKLLKE